MLASPARLTSPHVYRAPQHNTATSEQHLRDLAVAIDDLKSADTAKKTRALRSLAQVSAALGHDRTRSELLPYVKELIGENDSEFLTVLAEILPGILDLVGGPQNAIHVLRPLETLCAHDDLTVREKVSLSPCMTSTFVFIIYRPSKASNRSCKP